MRCSSFLLFKVWSKDKQHELPPDIYQICRIPGLSQIYSVRIFILIRSPGDFYAFYILKSTLAVQMPGSGFSGPPLRSHWTVHAMQPGTVSVLFSTVSLAFGIVPTT